MADAPLRKLPWFLVAASLLLAALFFYVTFGAYLPLKHRAARLESELRDLYKREAELDTRLAREEQRYAVRDRQAVLFARERDELARRLHALEQAPKPKPNAKSKPKTTSPRSREP